MTASLRATSEPEQLRLVIEAWNGDTNLVKSAASDDPSTFHVRDNIRMSNGRKPVSDRHRRHVAFEAGERVRNRTFRFSIERAGGFVQHE